MRTAALILLVFLISCSERKPGPLERAGAVMDDTAVTVAQGAKHVGKKVVESVDDAAEWVGEKFDSSGSTTSSSSSTPDPSPTPNLDSPTEPMIDRY